MLGSRVALATTHHPQTNGLTERMNRTLLQTVRKVCEGHRNHWVETLPLLEFAYNNSPHSATEISPFQAVQGSNPMVPASLLTPATEGGMPPKSYARQIQERLKSIHEEVRRQNFREAASMKRAEDMRRAKGPRFTEGGRSPVQAAPGSWGRDEETRAKI